MGGGAAGADHVGRRLPLYSATVRVFDANWMQIEEYLTRDDRIVMGGAYARPDGDMRAVWDAGVAEVRELLVGGWPE